MLICDVGAAFDASFTTVRGIGALETIKCECSARCSDVNVGPFDASLHEAVIAEAATAALDS